MFKKFRERPVMVTALRLDRHMDNCGLFTNHGNIWRDGPGLIVLTPAGPRRCGPGDWVIRNAKGELYPCTNIVFQEIYEEVI